MNKYLKFEYWNTCDLGNIYYQGGQHFIFYLDADVGEPIHEEVEEGQENGDGDFIATYRRQMKRYRIRTGLIPDYLIDAIQRMKLHDHIELTFKSGEIEQIYNVDCEVEWQFEKYAWQGTVTLTFDMDESITVGACCDNLTVTDAIPEWYWIATDGSDDTGDGHYTTPWKTLAYACTQVTTPGDVIHVKAGTYNETAQSVLAPGVSIVGQGATSIISTTVVDTGQPWDETATIILSGPTEGTDGSQSISYLAFDGNNYTADAGIFVYQRSNVVIHHVDMDDFHYYGIRFRGGAIPPTTYATGNEIHDCDIYDCGGPNASYGDIQIGGQEGMLIYNNNIYQPLRPGFNQSGFPIKYVAGGDNHGLKIYDNIISLEESDVYDEWHIAVELFGCQGGIEIYRNTVNGVLDFSDYVGSYGTSDDQGYGYAVKIYDNIIGGDQLSVNEAHAVSFERQTSGGVYIYNNLMKNCHSAITLSNPADGVTEDIYIYYNIIYNIGVTASKTEDGGIILGRLSDAYTIAYDNINIFNNVIIDDSEGLPNYGIRLRGGTGITFDNVNIKNNIIKDITTGIGAGISMEDVTCGTLHIENNCINGCTADILKNNCTITTDVTQNNITTDPLFVSASDFHLQSTSPCINAGIDVGLTTDYDGQPVGNPPEIGAYEY